MSLLHKTIKELMVQRDSAREKLQLGSFHDFTGAKVLVERAKSFDEAINIVRDNDKYEEEIDE